MNKVKNRYFIKLAYKGTNYHGWQLQDNTPTVQLAINNALSTILRKEVNITGCGRTDTGVHASNFYAHFDLEKKINTDDLKKLTYKLNNFLSKDIVIFEIFAVHPEAHARFDANSRTYQYFISKRKNPFTHDISYYLFGNIDIELMNKGAKILFDYSDFTSFSKSNTQVKTNICKIIKAEWSKKEDQIIFTISADRFLRNMVRAIVGTLINLGLNKINLDDIKEIIESKNRSNAGYSVPAKGLFLTEVKYPEEIIKSRV
ncbi:MAG: tRNA pseudouridine(38-40) synthase TruA [Bacteroidales bacterium]|nr:tRNA pseudouridine(38-40) synthase TruA [Bacteroidales bacterium]